MIVYAEKGWFIIDGSTDIAFAMSYSADIDWVCK